MKLEQMLERIREAKASGFDEAVFVGRNQWAEIMVRFQEGHITFSLNRDVDQFLRHEIDGLPVYLVNADNYFRVT